MDKFLQWMTQALNGWRFTGFKIVLVAVNTFIILGYSTSKVEEELRNFPLGNTIMDNPIPVILTIATISVLYQVFYKFLESRAKTRNDKSIVSVSLLVALERPVNKKRERFAEEVDRFVRLKSEKHTTNKVFKAITKPSEQSTLVIEALDLFLRNTYKDVEFKIGLMEVKNKKCDKWKVFFPLTRPPRTTIDVLNNPISTISRCISSGQIEIVQDVKKEINSQESGANENTRYIRGATSPNDEGSQLCYPLISVSTKEVIYVISISASKKKFFKESEKKHFQWILDRFAIRLALEHSLECLLNNKL